MSLLKLFSGEIPILIGYLTTIIFLKRNTTTKKHCGFVYAFILLSFIIYDIFEMYKLYNSASLNGNAVEPSISMLILNICIIGSFFFCFENKFIDNLFKFILFYNINNYVAVLFSIPFMLTGHTKDLLSVSTVSQIPRSLFNLLLITSIVVLVCFIFEKILPWILKKRWLFWFLFVLFIFPTVAVVLYAIVSGISSSFTIPIKSPMFFLISILSCFCLVALIALLFIVKTYYDRFDKKIKQQEMAVMEHQLQMQYEYFLSLEANRTEFQKLRHDTANHLQTLDLMLKTKNIDQAEKYLDELCGSYKENLSVKLSPNMPTNAVLINKKHLCEENKIAFECDIRLSKDIGISDVDMVSAVANIMDNAIEACKRQPDGEEKFLKFYAVLQKGCLVLEAKNSCKKDEKLLNVGDTSKHKKSDHGFGLAIIKDIAHRYDGDFKITAENGIVTASLLLFPQLKVGE